MESYLRVRSGKRWNKRFSVRPTLLLACVGFAGFAFFVLSPSSGIFASVRIPTSTIGNPSSTAFLPCSRGREERYLWYAPHSGFSNQLAELKNAILMAGILNRTLIIPPVLDHHAVALGSCPKFRVSSPSKLRASVWDHITELLRSRRFVSMADIIDLSSVISGLSVKLIDFRVFISLWCQLDAHLAGSPFDDVFLSKNFLRCRSLMSGLEGNALDCVYAVKDDCRTTVWTYGHNDDGVLDSFQPDGELRRNKKISYVRRRKDVYKAFGPGSEADNAVVLAFGSLFSSTYKDSELYVDIHEATADPRIESLLQGIRYLPFVPEIVNAGRDFAHIRIKEPFLCAQLRLLDGQFKNHWKATFSDLREKVAELHEERKINKVQDPICIFIMTDLPLANWTGSYLEELVNSPEAYRLYTLNPGDDIVMQSSRMLVASNHGLRTSSFSVSHSIMERNKTSVSQHFPDVLLYIEEVICSCASLGFIGTSGSTIASAIELMRSQKVCESLTT